MITVDFIILKCTQGEVDSCDVINNNLKLRTYILPDKLCNENREMLNQNDEIKTSGACFWDIESFKGEIISIIFFCLS